MPYNMLLLPLLGGYIFVRFWNYTRIHVLRSEKERLLIRASMAGLFALMIAYLVCTVGEGVFPQMSTWWRRMVPFEYSGVSFFAFLIGALGWIPLNSLYFTREREIDRAINEDADPMEILLKRAQDENRVVSVTMTNEKVYIGFVIHKFNPATTTNNISLFPLQSGYRNEAKQIVLTTNYSQAYAKMGNQLQENSLKLLDLEGRNTEGVSDKVDEGVESERQAERLRDETEDIIDTINRFEVVIPVAEITSIAYFDLDVHNKYFLNETSPFDDDNP